MTLDNINEPLQCNLAATDKKFTDVNIFKCDITCVHLQRSRVIDRQEVTGHRRLAPVLAARVTN